MLYYQCVLLMGLKPSPLWSATSPVARVSQPRFGCVLSLKFESLYRWLLFAAAIFTNSLILSFLVSGRLAELIRYRNCFLVNWGKASKFILAFLFFDRALSKSSGSVS